MPLIATPLARTVIGCAIDVHRVLGPGLLESVYGRCLAYEFATHGLTFQRQVPLPVSYKGLHMGCGYRLDFVLEGRLVVELKTVERLLRVHNAQALTYLKLSGARQALLINFHAPVLRRGIRRQGLSQRCIAGRQARGGDRVTG